MSTVETLVVFLEEKTNHVIAYICLEEFANKKTQQAVQRYNYSAFSGRTHTDYYKCTPTTKANQLCIRRIDGRYTEHAYCCAYCLRFKKQCDIRVEREGEEGERYQLWGVRMGKARGLDHLPLKDWEHDDRGTGVQDPQARRYYLDLLAKDLLVQFDREWKFGYRGRYHAYSPEWIDLVLNYLRTTYPPTFQVPKKARTTPSSKSTLASNPTPSSKPGTPLLDPSSSPVPKYTPSASRAKPAALAMTPTRLVKKDRDAPVVISAFGSREGGLGGTAGVGGSVSKVGTPAGGSQIRRSGVSGFEGTGLGGMGKKDDVVKEAVLKGTKGSKSIINRGEPNCKSGKPNPSSSPPSSPSSSPSPTRSAAPVSPSPSTSDPKNSAAAVNPTGLSSAAGAKAKAPGENVGKVGKLVVASSGGLRLGVEGKKVAGGGGERGVMRAGGREAGGKGSSEEEVVDEDGEGAGESGGMITSRKTGKTDSPQRATSLTSFKTFTDISKTGHGDLHSLTPPNSKIISGNKQDILMSKNDVFGVKNGSSGKLFGSKGTGSSRRTVPASPPSKGKPTRASSPDIYATVKSILSSEDDEETQRANLKKYLHVHHLHTVLHHPERGNRGMSNAQLSGLKKVAEKEWEEVKKC